MAVSWVGITLVDVAGLVLATGAAWGASKLATRRWGSTDLQGSPLWSWYLGQVFQVFVFPTIMIGALVLGWYTHAEEFTMERWLARGWTWELSDDGRPPTMFFERLFMYVLFAYMMKDAFVSMETTIIIHHIVSVAAILVAFMCTHGVGCFVATAVAFEAGSCSLSFKHVKSHSWKRWEFFIIAHTISNATCLYLTYMFHKLAVEVGPVQWFLIVASVGLIVARQFICTMDYVNNKAAALAAGPQNKKAA